MSQIDHDRLREELRDLAPISRTPATPVPGVRGRIRTIRRRRIVTGSVVTLACAGLIATALVPTLLDERTQTLTPAATPTPAAEAIRPGSPPGAEQAGEPVTGPGFEDFVEGRLGPGYLVGRWGDATVASYRDPDTGQPCLTVVGDGWERTPFCTDGPVTGDQLKWTTAKRNDGQADLLFGFAANDVHAIEPTDDRGAADNWPAWTTKTSDDVRFFAAASKLLPGMRLVASRTTDVEPVQDEQANRAWMFAPVKANDYADGRQGPGTDYGLRRMPGRAIVHKLNGTGAPCVTFQLVPPKPTDPVRVCLGSWQDSGVQWTTKRLPDGNDVVAIFTKPGVKLVDLLDAEGKKIVRLAPPSTDHGVGFAELTRLPKEAKVAEVRAVR